MFPLTCFPCIKSIDQTSPSFRLFKSSSRRASWWARNGTEVCTQVIHAPRCVCLRFYRALAIGRSSQFLGRMFSLMSDTWEAVIVSPFALCVCVCVCARARVCKGEGALIPESTGACSLQAIKVHILGASKSPLPARAPLQPVHPHQQPPPAPQQENGRGTIRPDATSLHPGAALTSGSMGARGPQGIAPAAAPLAGASIALPGDGWATLRCSTKVGTAKRQQKQQQQEPLGAFSSPLAGTPKGSAVLLASLRSPACRPSSLLASIEDLLHLQGDL
eukprot:1160179-Pelagomonas_calceolata.AAC.5